ncbi:DUF2911 domain-containing protein [Pedobacter rhizosphaerae]|uniref:DUF2911 domain-containing protein n=1 Tax=Pedobacter rhizosphaerae TaxID=390241 RepID=A0A1H9STU5_9SPHI|nr:DUF2911 domain-containing protein [Pedobacter rhizosphaerae]SER88265.1 Protein of unknown function [Pedobacter rhizosphaerae]
MKNITFILVTGLFLAACNNKTDKVDQKANTPVKTGHERHQMEMPSTSSRKYIDSINSGLIKTDTLKGSPQLVAMRTIGGVHLHMVYSSPGTKGRVIWGGLVPYDKVWVTGAHKATTLDINKAIDIGGKNITIGKYAVFTIPGKEKWTFILNKNYDQHLADDYNQSEDVVRVDVVPKSNHMVQRLRYSINPVDVNRGMIAVEWEKLKIEVPFTTVK